MMSKIGSRIQFIPIAWIALLCAFFSGCVAVPIRTATKTRNSSGEVGKKLDLDFIQVGTTTREEVRQKLGWIDTGVKDDRLFLGRWAQSSWGVAWAAGGPPASGAGGWERAWKTRNVVLGFDEKGVVQQVSVVPDEEILKTLSKWVAKDPSRSLDLSAPIEVPVAFIRSGKRFPGTLILGEDSFQFLEDRETKSKEAYDFKISPASIGHLSMGHRGPVKIERGAGAASDLTPPGNVAVTIHFKQKTSVGSEMKVRVDLLTMMTLIKYVAQTRPGSRCKPPMER